jgi:hypothetical protein
MSQSDGKLRFSGHETANKQKCLAANFTGSQAKTLKKEV